MTQYTTRPDTRLIVASSENDANMLWATKFFVPDPFIFIMRRKKKYLVINDLEFDRACEQASVDVVLKQSQYARRLTQKGMAFPSTADVIKEVLLDLKVRSVIVPENFPVFLADGLRSMDFQVVVQSDPFWKKREIKSDIEIRNIQECIRIAEKGMAAGIEALRHTQIKKNRFLSLNGVRMTSELLKSIINKKIMELGCLPNHTIVASGKQGVDPHNEGSGPIRAHDPIIIDIFPRSQKTGYFADMTRTVVRGHASEQVKAAYAAVKEAQKIGMLRIHHLANTNQIHTEILEHFQKSGFKTGFFDGRMQGFFHGTGHGLGLEVHEAPSFGNRSRNRLKKNHVVTVEPGLYYLGMGGIRLEDVVVVTQSGCRNLVRYPKFLEI